MSNFGTLGVSNKRQGSFVDEAGFYIGTRKVHLSFLFKELVQVRLLESIKVLQDCLEHAEILKRKLIVTAQCY